MGHDTQLSFGWYVVVGFWVFLILATVAVFIDSMLGYRKRRVSAHAELVETSREPLVMYTVATGILLAIWGTVFIPMPESYEYPITVAAALAAILAVVLNFTYLLRMVVPRIPNEKVGEYLESAGESNGSTRLARARRQQLADRHEVTVIDREEESDDNPKGA